MLQKPPGTWLASVVQHCTLGDLAPAFCQVAADAADAMCEASSSSDADSEHSTSSGYESDASIGEIIDEFGAGLSLQQKFPVQAKDVPPSPRGKSGHVWRTSSLLHDVALRAFKGYTAAVLCEGLPWTAVLQEPLVYLHQLGPTVLKSPLRDTETLKRTQSQEACWAHCRPQAHCRP